VFLSCGISSQLSSNQLYGGGPLNKQVGDYLSSQGVSIFVLYGS
jgi:hypothetical protein